MSGVAWKTVAVLASAMLAWVAISAVVDHLQPLPETAPTATTPPDAVQTKVSVQQQIPLRTPIADAVRAMAGLGYACTPWLSARYADMAEAAGSQSRGPVDVQRCDPIGQRDIRRWQVILEDVGGSVAGIGIGRPGA